MKIKLSASVISTLVFALFSLMGLGFFLFLESTFWRWACFILSFLVGGSIANFVFEHLANKNEKLQALEDRTRNPLG